MAYAAAMSVLEVRDLARRFGPVEALRGISFEVGAGDIFGYLGPNGAGKSTTLRVIMDLVRADRGTVRLFGGADHRGAAVRERVGYLPGELRLPEDLRAGELLRWFARFRPARPPVLRDTLLDALRVNGDTLARRVKHLSQGARRKLGLIVALQHDPDLWLLDEPTAGLDPLAQQGFRGILRDAAARGRAVLLSSHVLAEVDAVAGRVGIVRAGELVALESIAALRARTVRRLTVRFHGAAPSDLAAVPGVERVTVDGCEARLEVRGDVNPIVRRLASERLDEFVFPDPELEDIFYGYYAGGGAAGGKPARRLAEAGALDAGRPEGRDA